MLALRFAIFASIVLLVGCGREAEPAPAVNVAPPAEAPPHSPPLAVGAALPEFQVEGWLFGAPPDFRTTRGRVHVVDIWASWCPYCRQSAPGLVRLQKKYAARGAEFVSITNMGRGAAEAYAKQFDPPLLTGHGLNVDSIAAFGARSGMAMPGYDIAPTLYLVGPDRRIRWSDDQGRFRHRDPAEWEREVDAAIEKALASK